MTAVTIQRRSPMSRIESAGEQLFAFPASPPMEAMDRCRGINNASITDDLFKKPSCKAPKLQPNACGLLVHGSSEPATAIQLDPKSPAQEPPGLDVPADRSYSEPRTIPSTNQFIYPYAEIDPGYHERYEAIQDLFKQAVEHHTELKYRTKDINYELRVCGRTPKDAVASIVVFCSADIFKDLQKLFTSKHIKRQYCCDSTTGRLSIFQPRSRVSLISLDRPPFRLVFWRVATTPTIRKTAHIPVHAQIQSDVTVCGALIRVGNRTSTLGALISVDGNFYGLTVDHLFQTHERDYENMCAEDFSTRTTDLNEEENIHGWEEAEDSEDPWVDDVEYDLLDEPNDLPPDKTPTAMEALQSVESLPNTLGGHRAYYGSGSKVDSYPWRDTSRPYLDWALIAFEDPKSERPNAVYLDNGSKDPIFFTNFASAQPDKSVSVLMISGASGTREGVLLNTMSSLGAGHGEKLCRAWNLILSDSRGVIEGDCGSIVIDKKTLNVYGHVVGSNPLQEAYVVPLKDTINQIKDDLDATEVLLPDPVLLLAKLASQYSDNGAISSAQSMLNIPAMVRSEPTKIDKALHSALEKRYQAAIRPLVEACANPHAGTSPGETPLHLAARTRQVIAVIALLTASADIKSRKATGEMSSLRVTAQEGHSVVSGPSESERHSELDGHEDVRALACLIQCPQCFLPLESPVTLWCGHSVCRICLPQGHPRENISYPDTPDRQQRILCPVDGCHQETPVGNINIDITLSKVMESIGVEVARSQAVAENTLVLLEEVVQWDETCLSEKEKVRNHPRSRIMDGGKLAAIFTLAMIRELNRQADVSYPTLSDSGDNYRRLDHALLNRTQQNILKELDCHVCYQILLDPVTTPCGHTVCRTCLTSVFDHSDLCIICRRPLHIRPLSRYPSNASLVTLISSLFPGLVALRAEAAALEGVGKRGDPDVPLFVCTIAFPSMPTFIHVFEPRYRLMIRRALEGNKRFGMLMFNRTAAPQGDSGATQFMEYGTMLQVVNVQLMPDGRSLVEALGVSRFKVCAWAMLDGYVVGSVDRVEDISLMEEEQLEAEETSAAQAAASSSHTESEEADFPVDLNHLPTRRLFKLCIEYIFQERAKGVVWLQQRIVNTYGEPPQDPALLPYWLATILPIADEEKYLLLKTTSVRERLKIVVRWISRIQDRKQLYSPNSALTAIS